MARARLLRLHCKSIVTLSAMAALLALTGAAAAKEARPSMVAETSAPRDAGEPVIAFGRVELP